MRHQRYGRARIILMWTSLMVLTGAGAYLGSIFFQGVAHTAFALTEGIAAGAMLTMIAETMLPEASHMGGAVIWVPQRATLPSGDGAMSMIDRWRGSGSSNGPSSSVSPVDRSNPFGVGAESNGVWTNTIEEGDRAGHHALARCSTGSVELRPVAASTSRVPASSHAPSGL